MIRFLIENPFVVTFALLILTLIVYFSYEILAKHKRLEKHYSRKKMLLGVVLIITAFLALFTPVIGFTVNALFHPGSTEMVTTISYHVACSPDDVFLVLSKDCVIIELFAYTSVFLIIIGLILIIAGLVWLK